MTERNTLDSGADVAAAFGGLASGNGEVPVTDNAAGTAEATSIARLKRLAAGGDRTYYAGSLVVSAAEIQRRIATSGIQDPTTGW